MREEHQWHADQGLSAFEGVRISELPRTFTVVRRRLMDLDGNRAKEFLEERGGLGELNDICVSNVLFQT